jgi:hypothetical protein
MDNYNALRRIAAIADEVFSVGGSPIDALEKVRLIALESLQAAQRDQAEGACDCDEPIIKSDSRFCEYCELPTRSPRA